MTRHTTPAPVPASGPLPHHWEQGPQDVKRVRPFNERGRRFAHKFYWYLERVEGTSRRQALTAIYEVLHHQRSWERSGVKWVRTYLPWRANVRLRVIPRDTTVCGPGAGGCYSWGTGTPLAEVGVEYLGTAAFAEILNMELAGHGTFRMLDMYNEVHQRIPYEGVMGTWGDAAKTAYYPSDSEIESAKAWLQGRAAIVHED